MKVSHKEQGLALLMLVFLIALAFVAIALRYFTANDLKLERAFLTSTALAEAKSGLLSFSAQTIPISSSCLQNCPRPGDLPCPDLNNDGFAESSCNTQATRLGRLPWKTLGLGDLRDANGERLWYAVSNTYKNNTRVLPLNSDSKGTISLKDVHGGVIYDAPNGTGLAAIVIAPNGVLTRIDSSTVQNRSPTTQNIANNYLDIVYSEDNANFIDGGTNGFISGEIKINGKTVLNDVILPITRDEINATIEPRVLVEVMIALLNNTCSIADVINRTCSGGVVGTYLPDPANVIDISCITATNADDISNTSCNSDSSVQIGRIPVGGNPSMPPNNGWENKNPNSILRGRSNHNWFQQNGWRELIFYAVAPACTQSANSCGTPGTYLTLENAITPLSAPDPSNKGAILISAGSMLKLSPRNLTDITDYLEQEMEDGTTQPSNTYSRYTHTNNRNDRVISLP